MQYQQRGLPIENSIHVCVLVHGCSRRVPTDKSGFPVKCVFAIKGSDLEKTRFGDGTSLLGSLDAAVNIDVIVLAINKVVDPSVSGRAVRAPRAHPSLHDRRPDASEAELLGA